MKREKYIRGTKEDGRELAVSVPIAMGISDQFLVPMGRAQLAQYNTLCRHPELVSGSPANNMRFRVEPGMTAMNDRLVQLEVSEELAVPMAIGISSQCLEIANGWVSGATGSGEIGWGQVNLTSGSNKTARGRVNLACGRGKVVRGRVNLACGSPKTARGRVNLTCGGSKVVRGRVNLACGTRQMRVSEKLAHAVISKQHRSGKFVGEKIEEGRRKKLEVGKEKIELENRNKKYNNSTPSYSPLGGLGGKNIFKNLYLN